MRPNPNFIGWRKSRSHWNFHGYVDLEWWETVPLIKMYQITSITMGLIFCSWPGYIAKYPHSMSYGIISSCSWLPLMFEHSIILKLKHFHYKLFVLMYLLRQCIEPVSSLILYLVTTAPHKISRPIYRILISLLRINHLHFSMCHFPYYE